MPDILADLRKAGVGLEQLRAIARDFNITLSETPTQSELLQLQEAIKSFTLDKLTKTLQGAQKQLELLARVNPDKYGGLAGLLQQVDLLVGSKGVPAIADALKGLNLETSQDRATAIEKLMGLAALPPTGWTLSCFPVKIERASAGWIRAVALVEEDLKRYPMTKLVRPSRDPYEKHQLTPYGIRMVQADKVPNLDKAAGGACGHHNDTRYTRHMRVRRHPDGRLTTHRPDGTDIAPPD